MNFDCFCNETKFIEFVYKDYGHCYGWFTPKSQLVSQDNCFTNNCTFQKMIKVSLEKCTGCPLKKVLNTPAKEVFKYIPWTKYRDLIKNSKSISQPWQLFHQQPNSSKVPPEQCTNPHWKKKSWKSSSESGHSIMDIPLPLATEL